MQRPPTPDEVRELVRELDDRERKIAGGMLALMIVEPTKSRDQEWMSERFVQVAVVAHGFDPQGAHATTEDVATIESYARDHMGRIVKVALALFVRTAEELRDLGEGYTFDDAQRIVAGYLGELLTRRTPSHLHDHPRQVHRLRDQRRQRVQIAFPSPALRAEPREVPGHELHVDQLDAGP